MANQELENGIPRSTIGLPPDDRLVSVYGHFSSFILCEIQAIDPETPSDILTIGDNWSQLINLRKQPNPTDEIAKALQRKGYNVFGDMWPINQRSPRTKLYELMTRIQEQVVAGTVDRRILEKIAVLDLTQISPVVNRAELQQPTDTPWGVKGLLRETNTWISHITSGYAKQTITNLQRSPDNSFSTVSFKPEEMKWQ